MCFSMTNRNEQRARLEREREKKTQKEQCQIVSIMVLIVDWANSILLFSRRFWLKQISLHNSLKTIEKIVCRQYSVGHSGTEEAITLMYNNTLTDSRKIRFNATNSEHRQSNLRMNKAPKKQIKRKTINQPLITKSFVFISFFVHRQPQRRNTQKTEVGATSRNVVQCIYK